MKISQILLTTDFSDHARGAYRCAADLASKFHAKLHLVHFGGAVPFAGAIPRFVDTTAREPLFDSLENALAEEASTLRLKVLTFNFGYNDTAGRDAGRNHLSENLVST